MSRFLRRTLGWTGRDPRLAIASGLGVAALVLGLQGLGAWQALELALYDHLVRRQPERGLDPRLLLVTITEADVQAHGRWPLSDRLVAQLLATLQAHQPHSIGLDLVRDVAYPPGHQEFVTQLQAPNLVGIHFLSDDPQRRIAPPPSLPLEQVGFSNVAVDPDGRVRRQLLFSAQADEVYPSFSLQLVLPYLEDQGLIPELTPSGDYQLGAAVLPRLRPNAGGYRTIAVPNYQILLDYRRPEPIAQTVSLGQVLAGEVPPAWIRDRIVLIGPDLPSVRDAFFTPYSSARSGRREMPGVVLQGQMVSQLLTIALEGRSPLWVWPAWIETLWILLWALVGSGLAWRWQHPWALGGALSGAIALVLGAQAAAFQVQGWLPGGAPLLALTGSSLTLSLYAHQEARRHLQMVRRLLGQQTSPAIAEALWQARHQLLVAGRLAGQTMTATVMFTDIRNFSSIAEQHTAAVLLDWLNDYLNAMTAAVVNYGGLVNKFTGDGLMALFGVPVPRQTWEAIATDAQNAVACALAIDQALQQLNHDWQQRGWPRVQVRIGIHTGAIAVGSLGGPQRLEYGAIGDSVNIAARLQSCEKERQASDCRILIARETLGYLGDRFPVESWGALPLKGRQHLEEVFRILPKR